MMNKVMIILIILNTKLVFCVSLVQVDKKMYSVKTPDNTFIKFEYLSYKEGKLLLNDEACYMSLAEDQLDFFKRKAYLLKDNKILYEIFQNKSFYLFKDIHEYQKMLRGEKYYNTSVILDTQNKKLYSTFYLNPEAAYGYFKIKIKQLDKYPIFDGYCTYLMPDGSIAYLRHRINKLYDGYWYPSLQVFEHEYYLLTSDKYSPDPKL